MSDLEKLTVADWKVLLSNKADVIVLQRDKIDRLTAELEKSTLARAKLWGAAHEARVFLSDNNIRAADRVLAEVIDETYRGPSMGAALDTAIDAAREVRDG